MHLNLEFIPMPSKAPARAPYGGIVLFWSGDYFRPKDVCTVIMVLVLACSLKPTYVLH